MANELEPYENITRVFWIKVELKDIAWKGKQDFGEIRDVRSGAKRRIKNWIDIIEFMDPYLGQMGIRISYFWKFMLWINKINLRKLEDGITMDRRTRS